MSPSVIHCANVLCQNVRNNKNHRRTPKWVLRYGLVNSAEFKRKEKRSQWAGRYAERLPNSTLEDAPYEEGQEVSSSVDVSVENGDPHKNNAGEYWDPNKDEHYYGERDKSSPSINGEGGRWRYPANFEDSLPELTSRKKSNKKKKDKKDRWARTEDAYVYGENDLPKRRKSRKRRSTVDSDTISRQSDSTAGPDFPEDPEGGLYGETRRAPEQEEVIRRTNEADIFTHEL